LRTPKSPKGDADAQSQKLKIALLSYILKVGGVMIMFPDFIITIRLLLRRPAFAGYVYITIVHYSDCITNFLSQTFSGTQLKKQSPRYMFFYRQADYWPVNIFHKSR
jgi:hypothetical protein